MTQEILELEVNSLSHDGRAVGRHGQRVVFVRGALPGQTVRAVVTQAKKRFAEAECQCVLQEAPDAIEPACPHAAVCGGCPLQTMPYDKQLYWKESIVREALMRIAKIEQPPVEGIVPSPLQWGYRNKMEFAFAQGADGALQLGLRGAGSHAVFDVTECQLMPRGAMDIMAALRTLTQRSGYRAWSQGEGLWRFAVLRMPEGKGEEGNAPEDARVAAQQTLLVVITGAATAEQKRSIADMGEALRAMALGITGFVHEERLSPSMVAQGERTVLRQGVTTLQEQLWGVNYTVDHGGFFQVNTAAAAKLCELAAQMSHLEGKGVLWDLYCGVGAPGLALAGQAAALYGVEFHEGTVTMAERNAHAAGYSHCHYTAGDAKLVVKAWPKPKVVLVDPPRAGLHAQVVRSILKAKAERVIYISCNPATLARDLSLMLPDYALQRCVPVDLFPQTPHVESVALLVRN